MAYRIERLNLGGVLDQAIAITKDNFVLLFSIMLILVLPITLVNGVAIQAMTPTLPPHPTQEDVARIGRERLNILPVVFGLGAISLLIVMPLTRAAVTYAVARLYLGHPVTTGESLRYAFSRFLPLAWTSILQMFIIWVGFILCLIPGIYFSIWYGLAQYVVVIEGTSGRAALRRSKELVNPQRGTFLALGFVMLLISMGIGAGTAVIPAGYARVVANSLLSSVQTILWIAAGVVFYFSCRCEVENFDLHYLAQSIGDEPPDAEAILTPL